MISYHYIHPSIIESVTFKKADSGTPRAYLVAGGAATDADLVSILKTLSDKGYTAIHSVCDGQPALEVRGYMRKKELVDLLADQSWTQGTPQILQEPMPKKSLVQMVRDKSLPLASGTFLAADMCYATYGYKSARPEDMIAGGSYMIGSATMGLLGTDAQATAEIKKQASKLLAYAKEHKLDVSQNITLPAIVTEENKRSVFQNIIDTLQTYPAEIGNSFTGLAGALVAYASWKYRVGPNMNVPYAQMSDAQHTAYSSGLKDIGLGVMTSFAGMVGAWVKEKKHDPDAPPAEGLAKIWEWVQEKPLRIAGIGYMISTACHTASTIQEYRYALRSGDKSHLNAVPWRAGFIGFTLLSELLLLISSKGHGDGVKSDPSTDDSIISIAAEMIVQQKPDVQASLVENLGGFLGRPDVLGGEDVEIKARLAQKVEAMRHNPWIKATEATRNHPMANPSSMAAIPTWQAKMAAEHAVTPSLGV